MGIEQSIIEVLQKHLDQKLAEIEANYRNKISQIERDYVTDRYYNTKEAANYLSVSDLQLCKWVKSGQLNRYNFGHKMYRFRRSELDAFALRSHLTKDSEKEERPQPKLLIGKTIFSPKRKTSYPSMSRSH